MYGACICVVGRERRGAGGDREGGAEILKSRCFLSDTENK